jgi:beta-lactamase regulating signal transducer with metallopeptidase domain
MRIEGWFDFGDAAFSWFAGMMLVVSTAVVLAGAIGLTLKRRASARHAVWLCALAVVLLSPVLAWTGRSIALPPIALPDLAATVETAEKQADPLPASALIVTNRVPELVPPMEETKEYGGGLVIRLLPEQPEPTDAPAVVETSYNWPRIARLAVVAIWFLGALGLVGRLAWGFRGVARLRRSVRPFRFGAVLLRVASALRVGVEKLPVIGVSDRTNQPLTLGVIRPLVLVPEGLAERLSGDALRDVLIHECAHALRRDALVGLIQRFAAILCWPNPLVHLMNRELESAREELCDNHVLQAADPADYASSLLAVAESRPFAADLDALLGLPMIARRGSLESRIAALIDPRRRSETSVRRGVVAVLALLFLSAGATVAAVRFGESEQAPVVASSKPLDPTKTRIEGVVVDESGKPAGGVLVKAWTYWGEIPETRSGSDGRFAIDVDAFRPTQLVASNAAGTLQAISREVNGYDSNAVRIEVKLVLKPTGSTTVRVVDAQGAAVADAAVDVREESVFCWRSRTDATGEARFQVPADALVSVVVAHKSGRGLDYFENDPPGSESLSQPVPEKVGLVLNGSTTVKIRAVDTAGKPVAGLAIVPAGLKKAGKRREVNFLAGARITTDRDGVAVFDFVPSDLEVAMRFLLLEKAFCAAEWMTYAPSRPEKARLTTRIARTVPVSGRVFAADGKPAPAIMVRAEGRGNPSSPGLGIARTGADGSYRFDLPADSSYLIGVIDDRWAARSRGGIFAHEGMTIQHLDLHLEPGTVVRGRVTTGPDHEPVVGERVMLSERGATLGSLAARARSGVPISDEDRIETLNRWTKTDHDGRYAFRVGPGAFSLPNTTSFDEPIQVGAEPEIVHDYQIDRATPSDTLVVTVREAGLNGAPIPGAVVVALYELSSRDLFPYLHVNQTDSQGRFVMKRTPNLGAFYARSPDGSLAGIARTDSGSSNVQILLRPATRVLGRVVFPDGRPIARAGVEGEVVGYSEQSPSGAEKPGGRSFRIETHADGEGRFELAGIPIGAEVRLEGWEESGTLSARMVSSAPVTLEAKDAQPLSAPDLVVKLRKRSSQ